MSRLRSGIALLCALAWCSAVLHADLEAVGWMFEHDHHDTHESHHDHDDHDHADHADHDDHDSHRDQTSPDGLHDPIVARGQNTEVDVPPAAPVATGLAAVPPLSDQHSPPAAGGGDRPGRSEAIDEKCWQFLWRCAPNSAAPPTL